MNYTDIREARQEALRQVEIADAATSGAASLCAGRLRLANVSPVWLRKMKAELQDFNAVTGKWKVQP